MHGGYHSARHLHGDTMTDMVGPAVSPALVGRHSQIDELHDALDESRRGHCVTALVGGEAGAGKTRLVTEFAARLPDDVCTVTGLCVELGSDGVAYAPIAGVMRAFVAEFGAETVLEWAGAGAGVLAALLPDLDVRDTGSDLGRGRLFEVVAIILERAAAEHRVVVVIEDLQWADGSTRDLLRFVNRALAGVPVLLVLTYRTDEMTRTHPLRPFLAELDRSRTAQRIAVPRLTRTQVAQQISGILGSSPASDVVDRVFRRSEGLPFFVEELSCAENDGQSAGLSDSLRDLLLVRVEHLSRPSQEVLRLLSVGGSRASHSVLAAASDLAATELEEHLREAVSASVLRVDGDGYCFRHALLGEALQDDMLPGEHARLHRQFATALSGQPGPRNADTAMRLAYHLFGAGDHSGAFHAYLDAADHAAKTYAYPEAQLALERVLEMWELIDAPERESQTDHASLLARTASMAKHAGELERALTLGDAAIQEFGDDVDLEMRTELALQRARTLSDLGRPATVDELRIVLDALPPEGYELARARLLSTMGARLLMSGDFSAAMDLRRSAVEVAHRIGAHDVELKAMTLVGSAEVQLGEIEKGLATLERAKSLQSVASPGAVLSYHVNASDALCLLGRYEEAARIAQAGIDDARLLGRARTLGSIILGNAAEPLFALGHWDTAEALTDRGLGLDPPMRHFWQLTSLRTSLHLWRGDIDAATRSFADIRPILCSRDVDSQYAVPTARIAAEIALATDDPATAWAAVVDCLDTTVRVAGYDLALLATGARALGARRRSGDDIAADEQRLRTVLDEIGDWGPAPSWRALIDDELAESAQQTAHWAAAVDARQLPAHLKVYAQVRLSEAYLARGDRTNAPTALDAARTAAKELGAGYLTRLVDDIDQPTGAEPHVDNGLTPREREVLRLVAEGCSNGQIGERLVITTKTASVHVSNILAKLGVATRGEAAAIARTALDSGH